MEKETIIAGNKIKYFYKLNGGKAVFVFLHGWGSNYKSFLSIYKNLDNYIAFDFPGFGKSSKLKNVWTLSDYSEITKKFIDKQLPGKEIIFVAHSFGGRVLVKMINLYDLSNVKQIIFIGVPFIRKYGRKEKSIFLFTKLIKIFIFFLPKSLVTSLRKGWYNIISSNDFFDLKDKNLKRTFQNIINEDISKSFLPVKNYKASFIWGENDKEVPLPRIRVFSEDMGVKLYIVKGAGHFPFLGKTSDKFMEVFSKIIKG